TAHHDAILALVLRIPGAPYAAIGSGRETRAEFRVFGIGGIRHLLPTRCLARIEDDIHAAPPIGLRRQPDLSTAVGSQGRMGRKRARRQDLLLAAEIQLRRDMARVERVLALAPAGPDDLHAAGRVGSDHRLDVHAEIRVQDRSLRPFSAFTYA